MEVVMPQLGETVSEGTITAWYKSLGDRIEAGDNLFDVETDKASMEVPATSAGILIEIRVAAGEIAPVGAIVAVIADETSVASPRTSPTPSRPDASHVPTPSRVEAPTSKIGPSPTTAPTTARTTRQMTPFTEVLTPQGNFGPARLGNGALTTPYARRLASELKVQLSDIHGSGPQGRIVGKDVVPFPRAGSGAAIKAQYDATRFTGQPVDGMRAAIARRLTESKQTIPHFYLTIDVAMGPLSRRREVLNDATGVRDATDAGKVSLNDLLVEAWASALEAVPAANAVWAGDEILVFSQVDVSVAVALENGLVTPVIRAANTKSASEIAREIKDLALRARARKLKQDELRGGVSTVSNLGMHGIREFAAIINPPQSTILAVGASQRRPVEGLNGSVRFASMMTVTLACDHRVIDGVLGAILLAAFRERVEGLS